MNPFQNDKPYVPSPILGSNGFDSGYGATPPSDKVSFVRHTLVIDSRQRNCKAYPSPSHYKVQLGDVFKNINSIELKGSVIPRSSYNVHSGNNKIDFSIGSDITHIKILNGGYGYTSPPNVKIYGNNTVEATATTIITNGVVSSIVITNGGSGYSNVMLPRIIIDPPNIPNYKTAQIATAEVVIGTHYTAELRQGQYTIGGNPTSIAGPSGLVKEIQNAMNYAINGGNYNPDSSGPFEVRLVSQYPALNAPIGSPEAFDTNATLFNRIQITNINSDYWELLFCSGPNRLISAQSLMGFEMKDYSNPTATGAIGTTFSAGTTYRGSFDYDLLGDPKFVVLSFRGEHTFERTASLENSLNRKFGILVFDVNATDVIKDTIGTTFNSNNVQYLEGPVQKGSFWSAPGNLRALKGAEYDVKKVSFSPSIGKLSALEIQFSMFGKENELYDFQGRDHLLIFEITSSDNRAMLKT